MKRFLTIALSLILLFDLVTPSFAHRGSLDELGGHFRKSDCTYMLHKPTSLAKKAKDIQALMTLIKKYNSNSTCIRNLAANKIVLEGLTLNNPSKNTPSTQNKSATKKPIFPKIKINSKHIVKVIRVIDGDTIEVKFNTGATAKVRLIGVNTPETVAPNRPVEKYGKEASNYTKKND